MKTTRKYSMILVLCLIGALICSAFSFSAYADEYQAKVYVKNSASEVKAGRTFELTFDFEANFDVSNGSFNIYYDREALQFVSAGEKPEILSNAQLQYNNNYIDKENAKALRVSFASAYALPAKSGTLFKATFKALKAGDTTVTVKDGKLYDNGEVMKKCLTANESLNINVAEAPVSLQLKSGSSLKLEEGENTWVTGVKPQTKAIDLINEFEDGVYEIKNAKGEKLGENDIVGTKAVISLYAVSGGSSSVAASATIVVIDDVDGNGKVDSTDVLLLKRHMLNIASLDDAGFKAADSDGNKNIDSTDYLYMKRVILGVVKL